ncbi:MAG: hypothetical protein WCV90_05855 [Candidatus Woesearchaeota archaeon]
MDANPSLELIQGDLRAYAQLEPGTFQTAAQSTKARMTEHDLCKVWLYCANGNAYHSQKGKSILWGITPEEYNLILTHLFDEKDSSFDQLVQKGNFIPNSAESDIAMEHAVISDISQFRLQGDDATYRYLEIRTADGYVRDGKKFKPQNNHEALSLLELGFNEEYLNFLRDNPIRNIETTRLYVLNPAYVRKEAEGGKTLWRASWLNNFDVNSNFNARGRDIGGNGRLRGVRRVVAEGDSAPAGADVKKREIVHTLDEVLAALGKGINPEVEAKIRKLYLV